LLNWSVVMDYGLRGVTASGLRKLQHCWTYFYL